MAAIRSYAYLAYFLVFLCWGFCSAHRPVLTFKDEPVADKPGGLGIQKRFEGIWSWGNGGGGSIGYSPSGISGTIFDPCSGQGSGVGVDAGPGGSGHGSGGQASGSAGGGTSSTGSGSSSDSGKVKGHEGSSNGADSGSGSSGHGFDTGSRSGGGYRSWGTIPLIGLPGFGSGLDGPPLCTLVSHLEFGSTKLYVDCGNYTPVFGSIKVHDGEDLSGLKGSLMEALAKIQDIINHHHDQKHTTTEEAIAPESG